MPEPDDAIDRFISQPPEEGDGDRDEAIEVDVEPGRGVWGRLNRFLFEKQPSPYSSIAPRQADGKRSKPFFFSGNGRGR